MDLKSMLNDSAAQRPPSLHKPHPSHDTRAAEITPTHDSHSRSQSHSQGQTNRPLPYPPPLQPVDSRTHSQGGYFNIQSPHPNHISSASSHTSTPSAGPHSAYARSPGAQSQPYTPLESAHPQGAYNASFVPSPSLSVNQPPTPGSAYQHQNHTPLSAHSQTGYPPQIAQSHSPRHSHPPNGLSRQISPHAHHTYPQPATPLGPPINYNKISPQAQRPTSQGLDHHLRRASYSSAGSAATRDHTLAVQSPAENVQRQSNPDLERIKERERSVSVSPKTIPQASPFRQVSVGSHPSSHGRHSNQTPPEAREVSNASDLQRAVHHNANEVKIETQQTPTPRMSAIPTEPQPTTSRGPSLRDESLEIASPVPPPNLKRNASVMSDRSQASQMQPRKRLKREDIPIFAKSARTKPLRLGTGASIQKARPSRPAGSQGNQAPQHLLQQEQQQQHTPSPQAPQQPVQQATQQPVRSAAGPVPNGRASIPVDVKWEPSIGNISPFEDLSRRVCDWIFKEIGSGVPPSGGAMFEIEAKIGAIFDNSTGMRLQLPIESEAIISKQANLNTKFESSMNIEQHMLLNKYLNDLTREAFLQAQQGERSEILYDHPHEVDEFYELTAEGKRNLNPSIAPYIKRAPRVRRTIDRNTGQVKAQIIKSRIADLEIYNPNTDYDCRISISIESPWEGEPNWLKPSGDSTQGRHKDRMSYRHMAYQIDLTQVSHDNQQEMQHELEIEISTEQIRKEIENLQNGKPSQYEELVRGLLDNVRLLCRKGSVRGPKRLI